MIAFHKTIRAWLKPALPLLSLGVMLVSLSSCKKCKGEDPTARVTNNGTSVASVQIKTSAGNTENINNVDPGKSSNITSYAPGTITYTIVVDKVTKVETVNMSQCYEYNIVIDANNHITTTATDKND